MCVGLLGKLPRELRDIIYEDVLFHDCSTYLQACSCTKEDRRSKSGIALLRTCGRIHNEVVPLLYESEVFGISLGWEVSRDGYEKNVDWLDPIFYRQTNFGRQTVTRLPHNAFRLIQNLELNFTDEGRVWHTKITSDFFGNTNRLLRSIGQICANLEDSIQLNRLNINLSFCCRFNDIDYMTRLLEPIKKLRGIGDPNITVYGYQFSDIINPIPPQEEPRWGLTDEFAEYLEQLLMSPHGTRTLPSDELEVFEDDYVGFDQEEYHPWNEVGWQNIGNITIPTDEAQTDDQFMKRYLRDVYGTEDIEALHGGMPERWQVWLNSEVSVLTHLSRVFAEDPTACGRL